jgi:hypothetical protein
VVTNKSDRSSGMMFSDKSGIGTSGEFLFRPRPRTAINVIFSRA